jgi:hypothetical protein
MDGDTAARRLAQLDRGALQAAAGCGKTWLVATAVSRYTKGRQLVLTHTHAGVDALRRKLRELGADTSQYELETIAGWALGLALAYPGTAGVAPELPRKAVDYDSVYCGARTLLGIAPIQRILRASYAGVFVDEYQDCTAAQHSLIVALSRTVPCRIVGDPLQGIFSFRSSPTVDWSVDVDSHFSRVDGPAEGMRWAKTNPALGKWLAHARDRLVVGKSVDLRGSPVHWLEAGTPATKATIQRDACLRAARQRGSVVALHHWPNQCHRVASMLEGIFSCIESMEAETLHRFAERIDTTEGVELAAAVADFAASCMTKASTTLKPMIAALAAGRAIRSRKHPRIAALFTLVAQPGGARNVSPALAGIRRLEGSFVYRSELLREAFRMLDSYERGECKSAADAAWTVRNRTRRLGRVLPRCSVGTTLRAKGLQFDHAVVLQAEGYDAKNLYVALTRGATSLLVISKSPVLTPIDS